MFSFFKPNKEKKLEKLGYQSLLESYKQKVKDKQWTKKQYSQAVDELYEEKKPVVENVENINVATRQSFNEDEVMVPLNLQNIKQEYIDYDFIYSSLIFEYNNYGRVHTKALYELERHLNELFPDAVVLEEEVGRLETMELKQLLDEVCLPMTSEHKNYLKAVFYVLSKLV